MLFSSFFLEALLAGLAVCAPVSSSTDAFNLNPGFAGPYTTGAAAMLANTNAAPAVTGIPTKAHNLPNPIETEIQSSDHKDGDESIYRLMGGQSPYFPSDYGIYNFGMPEQCRVKQLHYVGRHGSRYPSSTPDFAETLENATFQASGELAFLNEWENTMGEAILTHLGRQQLFDHGVAQYYRYGGLVEDEEKLVVRSTTQQRMKESAMYFLSGFFGLEWEKHANLELLIEDDGYNNTLGWQFCPNNGESYILGYDLTTDFIDSYLANATDRFNALLEGNLTLTTSDVMSMQSICAYETNSFGSSKFCPLFTQQEWEGYEYAQDYLWYASNSFSNPTGRAMGVGWVVEFYQRLTNTPYDPATQTSENSTINSNPTFFPTDQSLYFDFTHDSDLISIVTALGLNQFRSNFTGDGARQPFVLSHVTPFGAFLNFEVIECDEQVPADRASQNIEGSKKTEYIHLIMNDSTVSLSINLPEVCESRADGWCELDKFIDYLSTLYEESQFEKSCFGDIDIQLVSNGVPE